MCQSNQSGRCARSLLVPSNPAPYVTNRRCTERRGSLQSGQSQIRDNHSKSTECTETSITPAIHQHQLPRLANRGHRYTHTVEMAPISITSVLISESVDPRCRAILEENGIRVTEKQNMKKDELIAEIKVRAALHNVQSRVPPSFPPLSNGKKSCVAANLHRLQSSADRSSCWRSRGETLV